MNDLMPKALVVLCIYGGVVASDYVLYGIGGEAIDCRDPRFSIREVCRRLDEQQRLLFLIGQRNRARGFSPTKFGEFVPSLIRQTKMIRHYPYSV